MIVVALGLAGCDDDGAEPMGDAAPSAWQGGVILAAADDWTPVDARADPFDDRPADVQCPPNGARPEDGHFEVETDICHYGTFVQPLGLDLLPGDTIEATIWHLELWAPTRSEGHVAIMLGDRLLWERRVPIPGQEAIYPVAVTLDAPAPAGTPLYFHVHNHGANAWRLLDIEATRD